MQPEILKYLFDIQESILSIQSYLTDERDFKKFQSNKLVKRAVERELEIIGEATNRILKLDNTIEISDARRIVDLRNWIIHGYDSVDDIIIWGIVSRDIPILKIQVELLLQSTDFD